MLVQSHTKQLFDAALQNDTHALLFFGPEGVGKGYIARYFGAQKLGTQNLTSHPYFTLVEGANGSISIDQIRGLQRFLQLKVPGSDTVRRVALIENAHTMTNEAQNALLKALEEPPADTIIMLTAPKSLQLKQTIYSRVQQVPVLPVEKADAVAYFEQHYSTADVEKAYMMSNGHLGLMHALLEAEEHPLAVQITTAKQVLAASTFDRLKMIDEISKQKDQLPLFFQACKLICTTALRQAAEQKDTKKVARWHKLLDQLQAAEGKLTYNPNPKLLLTDLFLHL